jgi:16S rRNA (adenine1518-N6/adenine1519-N6)-dimethyltransferase
MYSVTPKKRFGQHFLKDLSIAERIANTVTEDVQNVLEIGSGMGALTQFLIKKPNINLKLVEIDIESYNYLKTHFPNLQIFREDFLKMDLQEIFDGQNFGIIGNFPYNISTQILFKVLKNRDNIPFFAGMFQKEVAERICAANRNKTYGITSVLAQAFYKVEYLFGVSEHVFNPPPEVKSAVIRLIRKDIKTLNCNEKLFFEVVKTAFNQRRKTLRNSLKSYESRIANYSEITGAAIFNLRPEELSVNQFIELTNLIN